LKKKRLFKSHEENKNILNSSETMEKKAWKLENFGIFLIKEVENVLFSENN
jgi:hypothetical protein